MFDLGDFHVKEISVCVFCLVSPHLLLAYLSAHNFPFSSFLIFILRLVVSPVYHERRGMYAALLLCWIPLITSMVSACLHQPPNFGCYLLNQKSNQRKSTWRLTQTYRIRHLNIGQAGTQLGNAAWELYVSSLCSVPDVLADQEVT